MAISPRAALGLAAATAAVAVPASSASAMVVAYSDNANVVVENVDGSEHRAITTDGRFGSSYNHVGVNDAGDIAAIRRDGQSGIPYLNLWPAGGGQPKVNVLPTWGSGIVTTTFNGRLKADSRLYAYSFGRSGLGGMDVYGNVVPADAPGSPTGDGGQGFPDMLTATWHGESLVWSNGESVAYGKGSEADAWLAGGDAETYPWAEVSRDGSRLLLEINPAGDGPNKLAYQAMKGAMPNQPDTTTGGCFIPVTGSINGAALSPDGRYVAWTDGDALNLAQVAIPPGSETTCTLTGRRVLSAKGDDPQFSTATLRPPAQDDPGPKPPGGDGGPRSTGKAKLKLGSKSLRRALRKGLTVRLSGAKPGRTTVKVKRGRKLMASKKATVPASGKAKVKLRFTKRAKRSLKRVKRVKLTISAAGARTKVTLKR